MHNRKKATLFTKKQFSVTQKIHFRLAGFLSVTFILKNT